MLFQEQWASPNGGLLTTRAGSVGLVKDAFQIRFVCHLVSLDFKTPCLLRLAEPSWSSACVPLPGGLSRDVDTFFYKREKNKIVFYDSIGV